MLFHVLFPGYIRRPFLFLLKLPGLKCLTETLTWTYWAGLWVQSSWCVAGFGGAEAGDGVQYVGVRMRTVSAQIELQFSSEFIIFGVGIPSRFHFTVDICNPYQFIRLSTERQPF